MSSHVPYLLVDIAGTELTDSDKEVLLHPDVAGIILFAKNFHNKAQLRSLCNEIHGIRSPFIIAVDQEGGRVQRFREGFTEIPSMRSFGDLYAINPRHAFTQLRQSILIMCHELKSCGINLNFTPVLDLDDPNSVIIGERSLGQTPNQVIALSDVLINALHEQGFCAAGKHFPGHGGVVEDSHLELPVDHRSLEQVMQSDLRPFLHCLPKLDLLMSAHILFDQVCSLPPTFSRFWLTTFVREQHQYEGVIVSDDLTMKATTAYGDYPARALMASEAGCDLLICCNARRGVEQILDQVKLDHCVKRSARVDQLMCRIGRFTNQYCSSLI